jgi:hypothetical protein
MASARKYRNPTAAEHAQILRIAEECSPATLYALVAHAANRAEVGNTRIAKENERVETLARAMRGWNLLTEDVSAPPEIAIAISTGRPELCRPTLGKDRGFNPEETRMAVNVIRVLLETNQALQRHAQLLSQMTENAAGHLKGLCGAMRALEDFADFREPLEGYGDDD